MIDAAFYEDETIPDEWKARFPDWLVATGLKVQKDLLDRLSGAEGQAQAVNAVTAYLAEQRLSLLEPIQVSVRSGEESLYHDWMPRRMSTPARLGAQYAFLQQLAAGNARFCFWEDTTANHIEAVARMRRQNLVSDCLHFVDQAQNGVLKSWTTPELTALIS